MERGGAVEGVGVGRRGRGRRGRGGRVEAAVGQCRGAAAAAAAAADPVGAAGGVLQHLALPQHLQFPRPVAFVHGSELVAPSPHPVVADGCKEERRGKWKLITGLKTLTNNDDIMCGEIAVLVTDKKTEEGVKKRGVISGSQRFPTPRDD